MESVTFRLAIGVLASSVLKSVSAEMGWPPTATIWSLSWSAAHRSAGEPGFIDASTVAPLALKPTPSPSDSCGLRFTSVTWISLMAAASAVAPDLA